MPPRGDDTTDADAPERDARVELAALGDAHVDGVRLRRDGVAYLGEVGRSGSSPSLAVVELVAAVTDRPVTALPPLYDVVDPEDLDALCASGERGGRALVVRFSYEGFRVVVHGHGRIELSPT
jgi:hypothetical protein